MAKVASKRSGSAKSAASRKSPAKSANAKSAATKSSAAKKPVKKSAKKKSSGMMEKIVDMVGEVRKNMAKRRKVRRARIADAFSSLAGKSKATKKGPRLRRGK
jgi:hypothetical protein